jgi:hypothetical protein
LQNTICSMQPGRTWTPPPTGLEPSAMNHSSHAHMSCTMASIRSQGHMAVPTNHLGIIQETIWRLLDAIYSQGQVGYLHRTKNVWSRSTGNLYYSGPARLSRSRYWSVKATAGGAPEQSMALPRHEASNSTMLTRVQTADNHNTTISQMVRFRDDEANIAEMLGSCSNPWKVSEAITFCSLFIVEEMEVGNSLTSYKRASHSHPCFRRVRFFLILGTQTGDLMIPQKLIQHSQH